MKALLDNNSILVPWDWSDLSRQALNEALQVADSPQRIEVLHVSPWPTAVEPGVAWGTYSPDELRDSLVASFREQAITAQLPPVRFTALFGDPGSQIARHASDTGAGLIVISSHGRSGLSRIMLGSVAERVVRLAPCPVLVLRNGLDEKKPASDTISEA